MNIEQKFLLDYVGHCLNKTTTTLAEEFPWNPQYEKVQWKQVEFYIRKYNLYSFLCLENLKDDKFITLRSNEKLHRESLVAIARVIEQGHRWEQIKQAFENAGVECIALKGIITKDYYPIDVLRTMQDIDILYKENQHHKMEKALNSIGFICKKRALKHDHYVDDNGVHLELHREMVDVDTEYNDYYIKVWDIASREQEFQHIKVFSPEDMYIFTLVHMKEHLIRGEVTLKMIADVYVMQKTCCLNQPYISNELEKIGLKEFERSIVELSVKWFEHECNVIPDDKMYDLSEFVLGNQNFGVGNVYSAYYAYNIGKSKYGYYMRAMFPSLSRMKTAFLWLKKYPFLLPIAWLIRIIRAIRFRRATIGTEIKKAKGVDEIAYEQGERMSEMLKKYGL